MSLKLFSLDVRFFSFKMHPIQFLPQALSQTTLREFTALPRFPSWIWGRGKKRKKDGGKRKGEWEGKGMGGREKEGMKGEVRGKVCSRNFN